MLAKLQRLINRIRYLLSKQHKKQKAIDSLFATKKQY